MTDDPSKLEAEVQEAASTDEYVLRDDDGAIFYVDTVDDDGIYYHAGEGETYRASWNQVHEWFTTVPENEL